jgi:hypothetical protein
MQSDHIFYSLPLCHLKLQSARLASAQMVKNIRLESVLVLYAHEGGGRAQLRLADLPRFLDVDGVEGDDVDCLDQLSRLGSYDPYSLRHENLPLAPARLKLEQDCACQVQAYFMQAYKRPLLESLYGMPGSYDPSVMKLDRLGVAARDRLRKLAAALEIPVQTFPAFLDDYHDLFLSAAMYESIMQQLTPQALTLLPQLEELSTARHAALTPRVRDSASLFASSINGLIGNLKALTDNIKDRCAALWRNISKRHYQSIKTALFRIQQQAGSAICALLVKLKGWQEHFPDRDRGSLGMRGTYLVQDMLPGLSGLSAVPRALPM